MSRNSLIAAAGLLLLVLLAYLPAFRAGFIWDDDDYVVNNQTLRSADGLRRIWLKRDATPQYYPLVFTSFWVEYRLWGLPGEGRPATGYHVTNALLHAANAVLLWLALRRLAVPGAWLAAAVFALHPVHVESVAWITERKNVLSGLFYGLALLAYLRFTPPEPDRPGPPGRWFWYTLAFFFFLCALLSKTVTCSLPAVLVLLLWWKRGRVSARDALALAPMFALGLLMALVTVGVESGHVGARGENWNFSWADRCLIAGRALWFYAGKLLWPQPLIFYYPRWQIDASAWWQYLFPAAALAVLLALFLLRGRIGRGPVVAALFFAGTLLPALGFVNVFPMLFSFVADHFQYLASIGVIVPAAALAAALTRRLPAPGRGAALAAAALVLLVLGSLTWRQCHVYKDLDSLWADTLAKNPEAWAAHYNLGHLRLSQGRLDEAAEEFRATLRLRPLYDRAESNWGNALVRQGRWGEAHDHFVKAAALAPTPANYLNLAALAMEEAKSVRALVPAPNPLLNLAALTVEQLRYEQARKYLQDALAAGPGHAAAYHVLGVFHERRGEWPEAAAAFAKALELAPANAGYRDRLAEALRHTGQTGPEWPGPGSVLYEGPRPGS